MKLQDDFSNALPGYEAEVRLELIDNATGEVIESVKAENALTPGGQEYLNYMFREPLLRYAPGWAAHSTVSPGVSTIPYPKSPIYPFEYLILSSKDAVLGSNEVPPQKDILGFAPKDINPRLGNVGYMDVHNSGKLGNEIIFGFIFNSDQANGVIKSLGWAGMFPMRTNNIYSMGGNASTADPDLYKKPVFGYMGATEELIRLAPINSGSNANLLRTLINDKIVYLYSSLSSTMQYMFEFNEDGTTKKLSESNYRGTTSSYVFGIFEAIEPNTTWFLEGYNNMSHLRKHTWDANNVLSPTFTKELKIIIEGSRYAYAVQKGEEIYIFVHKAATRKILKFDLKTIESKDELSETTADAVYDVTSIFTNVDSTEYNYSYFKILWDPNREIFVCSHGTDNITTLNEDFEIVNRFKKVDNQNYPLYYDPERQAIITTDYHGVTYHHKEFNFYGMGTQIQLDNPLTKEAGQILKVTYTFNITP